MARTTSEGVPAYEVRCPRCDVSFPIETRTCIHCGGSTGPAARSVATTQLEDALAELGIETRESDDGYSIEEHAFPTGSGSPSGESANEGPLVQDDAGPRLGRSLLRSMPSLIWFVLLIAFYLARSCGGE